MATVNAWLYLIYYSLRRQLFSKKVLVAVVLLVFAAGLLLLANSRHRLTTEWFGLWFAINLFGSFIFPMLMLSFGTGALGDDREEKTLVYALTRPLPRWGIYVGKLLSVVPLALLFGLGGFWVLCAIARLGGDPGADRLFPLLAPAFLFGSLAYLAFFHLLAAFFRHSTIIAIVYVFFVEFFIGNMPGILKRISIRFYASSMIFDAGGPLGIAPPNQMIFLPIEGDLARQILIGIAGALLILGAWHFSRREYHDTV